MKQYISVTAVFDEDGNPVLNKKGKTIYKDWAFSDYFFADKPESITFDGFITLSKSFTVKVYAEDVWGNKSEPLEIKI